MRKMSFNYSGINAKVKAMTGELLTERDYQVLAAMKSVEAVVEKLSEHKKYADCLSSLDSVHMHRSFIEQRLVLSLSRDYFKIYSFISDFGLRRFLDSYFMQNRIMILKVLLGVVYDDRGAEYSASELNVLFGEKHGDVVQRLLSSKTVSEFVDNLKNTEFYSVLSRVSNEAPSLFRLEMELDLYYYMNLRESSGKQNLNKKNLRLLKNIIGTEIDLTNIVWAYRLKTFYNIIGTEIYSYLIPYSYRLRKQKLMSIAETKSSEELINEIESTPYGRAFAGCHNLEEVRLRETLRVMKFSSRRFPGSVVPTLAYLFSKQLEINNIISLLEGIRYRRTPEEIMKKLIIGSRKEVRPVG